MSCWRKRRKRTKEQEQAFQEQARRVALENGKRLGESPPHPTSQKKVRELGGEKSDAWMTLPKFTHSAIIMIVMFFKRKSQITCKHAKCPDSQCASRDDKYCVVATVGKAAWGGVDFIPHYKGDSWEESVAKWRVLVCLRKIVETNSKKKSRRWHGRGTCGVPTLTYSGFLPVHRCRRTSHLRAILRQQSNTKQTPDLCRAKYSYYNMREMYHPACYFRFHLVCFDPPLTFLIHNSMFGQSLHGLILYPSRFQIPVKQPRMISYL